MRPNVLVIGAGMAGITCAQALARAGQSVVVLDKGRGIGGRIATRRVELPAGEVSFDHGAQYVNPRDDDFTKLLGAAGAIHWQNGAQARHLVGSPGMTALPRTLAEGLDIRQGCDVTALMPDMVGWKVIMHQQVWHAPRVVVTIPAPQVAGLLGADHPLVAQTRNIRMQPCLTLMAAFAPDDPRPFLHRHDSAHPLAWVAQNSAKPGRSDAVTTWVAQAGPDWSTTHLELTPDQIAAQMLPLLCDAIGCEPRTAHYARAHRWRYARVARPLGQPFLSDDAGSLYLGGDWCLGARVEDAWASGRAIARDILGQTHVG
jgi:renalase